MQEKVDWFPIDSRILPFDLSLHPPKSRLVRIGLFIELVLALISVFGAIFLTIMPSTDSISSKRESAPSASIPLNPKEVR